MTVRKHLLTTGATGMLGSRLMIDALVARRPIAVLARSRGPVSARDRIEGILQTWERSAGRVLPRPVIIEADLGESGLAISNDDRQWLARNCDTALHSAASVRFYKQEPDGEPFRTNVQGLTHFLEVCEGIGIRRLHHVSTAYVCGKESGPILEDATHASDDRFGNDYEESKAAGERLVQSSSFLDTVTLFRPSIIVGDSQSGATSAFHGIYTTLQLGYLYLLAKLRDGWEFNEVQARQLVVDSFIKQLGLSGHETKNLVPVDWVSSVVTHIMAAEEHHGQVYHLTHLQPVSIHAFTESMMDAVLARPEELTLRQVPIPLDLLESDGFREHMHVYRSYFREDPSFDTRNTTHAAPNLPCPALDHATMVRMWQFAVGADFTDPSRKRGHLPTNPTVYGLGDRLNALPEMSSCDARLHLQLSGPGGGAWLVQFDDTQRPIGSVYSCLPEDCAQAYARADLLLTLAEGGFNIEQALGSGQLVLSAGQAHTITDATVLFRALLDWIGSEPLVPSRPTTH